MTYPSERSVDDIDLSASPDEHGLSASAPETAGTPSETHQAKPSEGGGEVPDVDTLVRERDDYKARLLRSTAEFENYRKRVTRERTELVDRITADVLSEILPIVDDLERALVAADEIGAVDRYREGVELIYRHLLDVLKKRGVTAIDAVGADFDPHLHHAVTHEPSESRRDGEVVAELRKGYKIGDLLLRASLVKVASGE